MKKIQRHVTSNFTVTNLDLSLSFLRTSWGYFLQEESILIIEWALQVTPEISTLMNGLIFFFFLQQFLQETSHLAWPMQEKIILNVITTSNSTS